MEITYIYLWVGYKIGLLGIEVTQWFGMLNRRNAGLMPFIGTLNKSKSHQITTTNHQFEAFGWCCFIIIRPNQYDIYIYYQSHTSLKFHIAPWKGTVPFSKVQYSSNHHFSGVLEGHKSRHEKSSRKSSHPPYLFHTKTIVFNKHNNSKNIKPYEAPTHTFLTTCEHRSYPMPLPRDTVGSKNVGSVALATSDRMIRDLFQVWLNDDWEIETKLAWINHG